MKAKATAQAMELYTGSNTLEHVLDFKTTYGNTVTLALRLSVPDAVSEEEWESAQMRFQDLRTLAVKTFQGSQRLEKMRIR